MHVVGADLGGRRAAWLGLPSQRSCAAAMGGGEKMWCYFNVKGKWWKNAVFN
jgi:hypothetical protein